jgi:hypothetical protein
MKLQNLTHPANLCEKPRLVLVLDLLLLFLLPPSRVLALEAIPFYQVVGRPVTGFAKGGAGFSFSPATNLVVLSLGFGGANLTNEPYQVCMWDTNGVQLACAIITTNSPLRNLTYYESILPLALDPGQTYYLAAAGATSGVWSGETIVNSGLAQNGTFSVATDISYLGYALSTNSAGVFPLTVGANSALMIGANFEYINGPLIFLSGLALNGGQAQVGFSLIGATPPSFILLEAEQPSGSWFTNLDAMLTTNVLGAAYSFTFQPQGQAGFFRVLAP